jgi:CTP synthase
MQMAVIEFARNVLGFKKANSTEVDPRTKFPVIHIMPEQEKYLRKHQYGGTIRLGSWPCRLLKGSLLEKAYIKNQKNKIPRSKLIYERHRHRYEFNNKYRRQFENAGIKFSGLSPDEKIVEAVELLDHPFFIGTQFHPEYKSSPLHPHPLFLEFIKNTVLRSKNLRD